MLYLNFLRINTKKCSSSVKITFLHTRPYHFETPFKKLVPKLFNFVGKWSEEKASLSQIPNTQ